MANNAGMHTDHQATFKPDTCFHYREREAHSTYIWHWDMLGFIPGEGTSAHWEVQLTVCNAASQLVSSKHIVCGVWECGPSLCGAAWHKATGKSRWLRSWCCRSVRLSPATACKDGLWSAPLPKSNNLGSRPLSCPLNWAARLREMGDKHITHSSDVLFVHDRRNTCMHTPVSPFFSACISASEYRSAPR